MSDDQMGLFPEPPAAKPDPMQAVLDRLAALEAENRELRQTQIEQANTNAIPNHLTAGGEIAVHPGVARHVVVGTRPVFDSPNDPLWRRHNKVDPGSLARKGS